MGEVGEVMRGGESEGPGITLRVSRDGGRTWGPRVVYYPVRDAEALSPLSLSSRFPACACPRCGQVK